MLKLFVFLQLTFAVTAFASDYHWIPSGDCYEWTGSRVAPHKCERAKLESLSRFAKVDITRAANAMAKVSPDAPGERYSFAELENGLSAEPTRTAI